MTRFLPSNIWSSDRPQVIRPPTPFFPHRLPRIRLSKKPEPRQNSHGKKLLRNSAAYLIASTMEKFPCSAIKLSDGRRGHPIWKKAGERRAKTRKEPLEKTCNLDFEVCGKRRTEKKRSGVWYLCIIRYEAPQGLHAEAQRRTLKTRTLVCGFALAHWKCAHVYLLRWRTSQLEQISGRPQK